MPVQNTFEMPKPFEPKKSNRFTVEFGEPFNIPIWSVKEASRPTCRVNGSSIKWNDMEFVLYDPISPSVAQDVVKGLRELRTKDSPIINIKINMLDPIGTTIEEWVVTGQINTIDFGELDWNNDEVLQIRVYVNVHYAVLNF